MWVFTCNSGPAVLVSAPKHLPPAAPDVTCANGQTWRGMGGGGGARGEGGGGQSPNATPPPFLALQASQFPRGRVWPIAMVLSKALVKLFALLPIYSSGRPPWQATPLMHRCADHFDTRMLGSDRPSARGCFWLSCTDGSYVSILSCSMPCHALPCHAMPCHAMPCPAMPCPAMPCHAMPCHAMPCHAMPCQPYCTVPHRPVLHHTLPCHAVPYRAIPYRATPCHAVPHYTMPCPALPHHILPDHAILVARKINIWSRCDCCGHQMKDAIAEVLTAGGWVRCGGTSTDVGTQKAFTFECAAQGTAVRVKKSGTLTISEVEVFPQQGVMRTRRAVLRARVAPSQGLPPYALQSAPE